MGFYGPSAVVTDAQRRGVRFHPIDVQVSDWDCTVEADGAIRLGLRYVNGLRQQAGKAIATAGVKICATRGVGLQAPDSALRQEPEARSLKSEAQVGSACPKCGCDDESMLERVDNRRWFCSICSHDWAAGARRFVSLDDLVARTGLRRDEVVTLADIGALNAFGYDRRSALWQAERAVRPSGELFDDGADEDWAGQAGQAGWEEPLPADPAHPAHSACPLKPMTE